MQRAGPSSSNCGLDGAEEPAFPSEFPEEAEAAGPGPHFRNHQTGIFQVTCPP